MIIHTFILIERERERDYGLVLKIVKHFIFQIKSSLVTVHTFFTSIAFYINCTVLNYFIFISIINVTRSTINCLLVTIGHLFIIRENTVNSKVKNSIPQH